MKANLSDYLKDRLLRIRNKIGLIDEEHLSKDQKQELFKACENADYTEIQRLLKIGECNTNIYNTENHRASSVQLGIIWWLLDDFKNACIGAAYRNILEATILFINDENPYHTDNLRRIAAKLEIKDVKSAKEMLTPFFKDFLSHPETHLTNLGNKSAIEHYLQTAASYLNILEPTDTGAIRPRQFEQTKT